MPIVKVDKKGRITLPKQLTAQYHIRHGQSLVIKASGSSDMLLLSRLTPRSKESEDDDPLMWSMRHPLKTGLKGKALVKRIEELKREAWSP